MKINKGLRHFSMKVCQKVEEKHVTSYNEVADELVREFVTMRSNDSVSGGTRTRREREEGSGEFAHFLLWWAIRYTMKRTSVDASMMH